MAPQADKRRAELVVPFVTPTPKSVNTASSLIASTLPMAAMFTRIKILSWSSIFTSLMSYMNEPSNAVYPEGRQSALFSLLMSFVGLATCYMDLVFPGIAPGRGLPKPSASPSP